MGNPAGRKNCPMGNIIFFLCDINIQNLNKIGAKMWITWPKSRFFAVFEPL